MAVSTRSAMRLLSPRLQSLSCRPPCAPLRQFCRASSRYSNPSPRNSIGKPSPPTSFLDVAVESNHVADDGHLALDERTAREHKRQYHLRRMRFAGMGLFLSVGGLAMLVYNLDLDDMNSGQGNGKRTTQSGAHRMDASDQENASFQGKEVHVIGAGDGKRIVAQGAGGVEVELVETGTSSVPHFPRTIFLPQTLDPSVEGAAAGAVPNTAQNPGNVDNQEEYTLVGLGIRTVMWIQVYVVGLYIRTQDISTLQEKLIHHVNPIASTLVPAEKEDLRQKLLDPAVSREVWSELLQVPGLKTAWRVSPTRNTDFSHLRDGFVTGINKRTQEAKKRQLPTAGGESEYDSIEFGQAVQDFKAVFAGGKAPKGSILIMRRDVSGALDVLFQAKPDGKDDEKVIEKLGSVTDERIARLIWLGYLAGDKVSSEAARKGVVEGCVSFASRPVGSVETMVT